MFPARQTPNRQDIEQLERQLAQLKAEQKQQLEILEAAKRAKVLEENIKEASRIALKQYVLKRFNEVLEWGTFGDERLRKMYWERFEGDKGEAYIHHTFRMLRSPMYGVEGTITNMTWNGKTYKNYQELYQAVQDAIGKVPFESDRWFRYALVDTLKGKERTKDGGVYGFSMDLMEKYTANQEIPEPDPDILTTDDTFILSSITGTWN